MILVTGATGKLGRRVIESLLERIAPSEIVAGVRDPEKAFALVERGVMVRALDYDRPETLGTALAGVTRALLISGTAPNRVEQHRVVIQAARRHGVRALVYTSGVHADRSQIRIMADHRKTEQILRESGAGYVILRNDWYMENYTDNLGALLEHGTLFGSAGDGRVSVAARKDYAEAAAIVLTTRGHEGKVYELGGEQAYTLAEIAAEIARASGTSVVYRDLPEAEYAAALERMGVPAAQAALLADADSGLKRGDLFVDSGDLRRLLARPTTPLSAVLEHALSATERAH